MPLMQLADGKLGGGTPLRNEPVQARSTARLTALLDAAAAAIDELGYERLTTAMVAERAGASIGTVYRYFPDRIAVLQALASRNLEFMLNAIDRVLADGRHSTWRDVVGAAFDAYVLAFRTQAGFASLRTGDVLDLRPAPTGPTANAALADALMKGLTVRFGTDTSPDVLFTLETAIEVQDALIARAFARSEKGDAAFLSSGRELVLSIVNEQVA